MYLNELVIKSENELNTAEKSFLQAHNSIISAGVLIQNGFVTLAKNLKLIKDEKLYLTIDCETFEDYTEKVIGLKRTQAYKYIQVLENLGEEFSTRVEKVGITKLALISSLTTEEQQEVIQNNNLEETTVSELKAEIQKLKNEKIKVQEEANKTKHETSKLNDKITKLKADLKAEKEKPVQTIKEVVQDPEQQQKIESLEMQLRLKEKLITQRDEKLKELNAQTAISNSEELAKFKVIFENVQTEIRQLKLLISQVPEEKQEGLKKALKAIGEQFC